MLNTHPSSEQCYPKSRRKLSKQEPGQLQTLLWTYSPYPQARQLTKIVLKQGMGEGVLSGAIPAVNLSHLDVRCEIQRTSGRPEALVAANVASETPRVSQPILAHTQYFLFFFCNLASVKKSIFSKLLIVYLRQL